MLGLWRHVSWSIDLHQSHLSYAYISHLRQFALGSNYIDLLNCHGGVQRICKDDKVR
jgi:hypothetical protein